jgi:nucleotide-binding universal stress UspA family protein
VTPEPGQAATEETTRPAILVPLDGSPLAEAVLPHALALAQAAPSPSKLVLARVVEPQRLIWPGFGAAPLLDPHLVEEIWQAEIAQANAYLADVRDRLAAGGIRVETKVLDGDPASEIVGHARQVKDLRLITMATHGTSGFRRWLLGGVSEKVLRASPVPLLLVRPDGDQDRQAEIRPAQPYRLILVPLDGSPLAEQALRQARDLAARTGAALLLLTVLLTSDDYRHESVASEEWAIADQAEAERMSVYLSDIARELEEEGLQVRTQLVHGYPPEEILRVSEEMQSDMVVMSTHGRGGLQLMWLGSVALKVVQSSRLPVLIVRPGGSHENQE